MTNNKAKIHTVYKLARGYEIGKRPAHSLFIYAPCIYCGQERWTRFVKGEAYRKACRNCQGKTIKGRACREKNYNWRGGRYVDCQGYVLVLKTDHPYCDSRGYVYEHRLIMESIVGRLLQPTEVVHHIDNDHSNNTPANLKLFASKSEHTTMHLLEGATTR